MSHCNGSKPHSPLRQATTDYMQLAGLAPKTQQAYLRELNLLANYYQCSPIKLSAEQVEAYILGRIEAGLKPNSTNLIIAACRLFYVKVVDCPERVARLSMRRVPDRLPNAMDESQIQSLLDATRKLRYRAAIELSYSAGLRISEVVALQIDDIDSAGQMIHVRCGKGGHERVVFVPPEVFESLRRYWLAVDPKPSSWVFYGQSPDKQLKVATLRGAFNTARKSAGLDDKFTFHSLRHSIATNLFDRGARRDVVQDLLGHKSDESTRVYARTTATTFRDLDHPAKHLAR